MNTYASPYGGPYHGNPVEYAVAPAIPAQNDPGWANCGASSPTRYSPYAGTQPLCPNASTIGMAVGSILPGCWSSLNFTSFQALVSIPANTTISTFSVNMSGADDGARISLVNSAYPNGVTPSGGYIWQLTQQSTGNLASYVVPGEVNRVVITQVDDCAVGNNLHSAQISLNGTVIPVAPTANPVATPAANSHGWNNSDVTVNWNWTDSGSGIDPANCTQTSTSSGEGTITLNSNCQNLAGIKASDSYTVKVDKTAPSDNPVLSPAPNSNGWNSSDPTVNWNWTDSGSGIDPANCTQTSTSSGQGTITLISTCADLAGNTASASVTVNVDTTPPSASPVVTPAANGAGWNNTQVGVNWNWTDNGSGIDPANCTQTSTSSGQGTITLTSTCADLAGNTASASVTVNVDTIAPTISFIGNAGTYSVAQSIAITCSTADSGSGVATQSCPNVVSAPAWSLGVGTHTYSASATDVAGNVGSGSTSFTVSVDENSLCALATQFSTNSGIANSLCVKLNAAAAAQARGQFGVKANDLSAFVNEVKAQSGKAFTAAQAALLISLASTL